MKITRVRTTEELLQAALTLDDLKDTYHFRGLAPDFAIGRRQHLRYAVEMASAYLTELNPKGPDPWEYLEYAKLDILGDNLHAAINALGNVKRAVHLTIESFLKLLGLEEPYTATSFPTKLGILQELNAFPTRVIGSLNRRRNLVEHEYVSVELEEVTDLVDIAEMFLLLAYPYLKHTVVGAYVGLEGDERCLEWSLDHKKSAINIYEVASTRFIESPLGKVYYNIPPLDEDIYTLTDTVSITKSNTEEWLPYLDLFVYCTKKLAVRLPIADDRGDGMYTTRQVWGIAKPSQVKPP